MARGLNKILLIGNVERAPEMRYTPSGRPVTSFSIAVKRTWSSGDGERREETEWFNIVAWGALAELCNAKLHQGKQTYIEGRVQTRSWQDGEGKQHFRTEVVANEVIILSDTGAASHEDDDDYGAENDDYAF